MLNPTAAPAAGDSITVRQGRQIVPIVPNVVRKHPTLAARGMLVEQHANGPAEFPERELQQHNFFLYTGASVRADVKSPSFTGTHWMRPGSLWVMPQGSRHQVRFEGDTSGIALALDPTRFNTLIETADGKASSTLVESLAACPPKIEHLMRALHLESSAPSTQDHLGLECLATVVALAVSQHAGAVAHPHRRSHGLAPRHVRAVEAYVSEHLHRAITLAELAAVAGLSVFHFLRAFKRTTGLTPGQYVAGRRIQRACSLLKTTHLTVAEVAASVGFDHASHFTRSFRLAMRVTPTFFRLDSQK